MLDILPGFASIHEQHQPIRLLKTLLRKGTIPHALLFTGIEGIGKRTTAAVFAMACLCRNNQPDKNRPFSQFSDELNPTLSDLPCTQCASCRRVASGNHPDFIRVDPEGAYIRIGQIRSLCATLSMKPYEDGFRIVVIANAHAMNIEAANALLKLLEEPPDRTIMVLTATAASALLPTIASRCQRIQFKPLPQKTIIEEIVLKKDVGRDRAAIIASLANGSMSKAFELIESNFAAHRDWLLDFLIATQTAYKSAPLWHGMALAEHLFKKKEMLDDSLEIIKSWLRDLMICPYSPDKIIHLDRLDAIRKVSASETTDSLLEKLDAVQHAQKIMKANGNLRLALEIMAMKLVHSDNGTAKVNYE